MVGKLKSWDRKCVQNTFLKRFFIKRNVSNYHDKIKISKNYPVIQKKKKKIIFSEWNPQMIIPNQCVFWIYDEQRNYYVWNVSLFHISYMHYKWGSQVDSYAAASATAWQQTKPYSFVSQQTHKVITNVMWMAYFFFFLYKEWIQSIS